MQSVDSAAGKGVRLASWWKTNFPRVIWPLFRRQAAVTKPEKWAQINNTIWNMCFLRSADYCTTYKVVVIVHCKPLTIKTPSHQGQYPLGWAIDFLLLASRNGWCIRVPWLMLFLESMLPFTAVDLIQREEIGFPEFLWRKPDLILCRSIKVMNAAMYQEAGARLQVY